MATDKIAVIVGAGSKHDKDGTAADLPPTVRWGLGGALPLRFAAGGFHVVLLARRVENCEAIVAEVRAAGGTATMAPCDVTDDASVKAAFDIAKSLGTIEVIIYNAAPGLPPGRGFGDMPPPHEIDPAFLAQTFDIGVTGCVRCVREGVPEMLARGRGTILLSGATMSLRGGAKFGTMAPCKAALRSMGQSMFQEYAPQGVHVAHVIIDGIIDSPNTRAWGATMYQDPADLADAYFSLHEQKPSVWSYEIQLSPCKSGVGMRM